MPGILVGYARTSTCDQQAGLDAQIRDLKAAGCEEIFSEQVSALAQRDRLKEALRFVRRNDTLVCCKPDRLARSTTDLLRIVDDLDRRGVGLIMLSMGGQRIDTRSPTGKLMITMLAAIAEFERGLLLERQREGVAKARADGKYKGRQPTARAKAAEVIRLDAGGLAAHRNRPAHRDRRSVRVSGPRRCQEAGCWSNDTGVRTDRRLTPWAREPRA